jgi:inhibitor of KinA
MRCHNHQHVGSKFQFIIFKAADMKVAHPLTELLIYAISETALTVELGSGISKELMIAINRLDYLIYKQPFAGLQSTVAAYTTLSIFYDPMVVIKSDLPGKTCFDKVNGYIRQVTQNTSQSVAAETRSITIPVCYGGTLGPDLAEVAQLTNLTTAQVIEYHTSAIYLVHMIGFIPGFAYLGGMPPAIAAPRRAAPRPAVAAGSVGIAGEQTGIYPLQTPGGWQLIGQTPLNMFDLRRHEPSMLKAGDTVTFKSIDADEFDYLKTTKYATAGS